MENFIVFNYINEYIEFIIVLFIFSLYGIVFKANNFIKLLIYIEIIILIINFNFIFFSFIIDDIIGQIFSIFILAIIASESAIILAILIIYYKIYETISIYKIQLREYLLVFFISVKIFYKLWICLEKCF